VGKRAEVYSLKIEPVTLDLLPLKSRARIEKFRFSADMQRSAWGEILARVLLARRMEKCALKIEWMVNEHGKPFISGGGACFNIAHSGEYVIVAIDETDVGVDIEKIRPVSEKISRRVFMENERRQLKTAADPELEFCRIWTLKESYVKYTGRGIADLKTFDVTRKIPGIEFARFLFDGYAAAVCSFEGRAPETIEFCDAKTILKEYGPKSK